MSVICPKDMRYCPDDLCNGGGVCVRLNCATLELCQWCQRRPCDGDLCDRCATERDEEEL